jgi:hypothetical protein
MLAYSSTLYHYEHMISPKAEYPYTLNKPIIKKFPFKDIIDLKVRNNGSIKICYFVPNGMKAILLSSMQYPIECMLILIKSFHVSSFLHFSDPCLVPR